MKFSTTALAAALALCVAPAFAADQVVDLSSGVASFIGSAPVLDGGDDVITFTGLAAGSYSFLFTLSSQFVTGLTATVNGQSASIQPIGTSAAFAYLSSTSSAPFSVTLTGTPGAQASYSGELSVQAVPEPETYALLLAGLGVVGFVIGRRRN
jgi:hypothetical protein